MFFRLKSSLSHFLNIFSFKEEEVDETINNTEEDKKKKYFGGEILLY